MEKIETWMQGTRNKTHPVDEKVSRFAFYIYLLNFSLIPLTIRVIFNRVQPFVTEPHQCMQISR
jgi:hypothetical protein